MWLRETAKIVAGVLLAAVLLWWVLHGTDSEVLLEHLREASILGLIVAAGFSIGHNVFRVLRWRALLEPVRPAIPFRPMFSAIILGYATSWVVPGRLGELVRPALLAGRERLPLGPCLGSVVADRLLDGMAVLVLFGLGAVLTPLAGDSLQHVGMIRAGALGIVAVIGIPLVLLLLASNARAKLEGWLSGHQGLLGWIGRSVLSVSRGVEALKRPALLLRVAVHTALAWLMIAVSVWLGMRACGVDISFAACQLLLPLLVLGIALPTPAGAGGYHAAVRVGLTGLFGVTESLAVGAALLLHAVAVLPAILLGALLLFVERVTIQDLRHAIRQVRELGR